jgi:hypothetical protein
MYIFLFNLHHSVVVSVSWIIQYGEIAISTAKVRPTPEISSPNDKLTMASSLCPLHVSGLLCTIHELLAVFFCIETNGYLSISAAGRHARSQVKSPTESSIPVFY